MSRFRTLVRLLALAMVCGPLLARAAEPARNYLWTATTLRAAPGALKAVIADLKALKAQGYYGKAGRTPPLILRHSQGDQWDVLLLEPIGSYSAYFAPGRLHRQNKADTDFAERLQHLQARIAFEETLFAFGPAPDHVRAYVQGARFFHIEMFNALPGKKQALLREREMENAYLEATKRRGNLIFSGDQGSDVDSFTIGAYPSLATFAARPDLPPDAFDAAARAAGFADGDSIGFYLRSLIAAHHDTLANLVD